METANESHNTLKRFLKKWNNSEEILTSLFLKVSLCFFFSLITSSQNFRIFPFYASSHGSFLCSIIDSFLLILPTVTPLYRLKYYGSNTNNKLFVFIALKFIYIRYIYIL